MTQTEIAFAEIPLEKMTLLSKEDLMIILRGEQSLRQQMQTELERLRAANEELKQRSFLIEDQLVTAKSKIFGKSSEKSPPSSPGVSGARSGKPKSPKSRVLLPSERYPDAQIIVRDIEFQNLPACSCCSAQMQDSGLTEDSEFLTVVPQQHFVVRQKRHKYSCHKCHGDMKTAPPPPRITPGSSYSDEMAIDVGLSKYCDLIPVERYASIAKRAGMSGLPPQSLIEITHQIADFTKPAYEKLRAEILKARVLSADETTHRMLEGSSRQSWYLWGFSTPKTSYFELHATRSGEVASLLLASSNAQFLVSDVFSGYGKAVKDINKLREVSGRVRVQNVYCNAHARRKFKEALKNYPDEAGFYLKQYRFIYRLETLARGLPPDVVARIRHRHKKYFERMRLKVMADLYAYSSKSSLGKAMSYFLENFEGLTRFANHPEVPIDNNSQERLLRSPVIGRKTWYGTHSERGAETAAVLFSLVESCKLNGVNPRAYFKKLVEDFHNKKSPSTPSEFKDLPA